MFIVRFRCSVRSMMNFRLLSSAIRVLSISFKFKFHLKLPRPVGWGCWRKQVGFLEHRLSAEGLSLAVDPARSRERCCASAAIYRDRRA